MMGGAEVGAWMFVWIFLGVAVMVIAGVATARALGRQEPTPLDVPLADSRAGWEAQEALKMR